MSKAKVVKKAVKKATLFKVLVEAERIDTLAAVRKPMREYVLVKRSALVRGKGIACNEAIRNVKERHPTWLNLTAEVEGQVTA